jgi:SnoaL-like domain
MTNLERAKDIYAMIGQGQLLEAFDKYYAEDVVMQDVGEDNLKTGKADCRAYEVGFLGSVESFNGMGVDSVSASEDGNTVAVESWMELQFKGTPAARRMSQVAVQKWENGFVKEEKFYHK